MCKEDGAFEKNFRKETQQVQKHWGGNKFWDLDDLHIMR